DDTSEAAGSIATAIGRFAVATADTEDANVARTLTADADTARAIEAIRPNEGGWSGARYIEASSPEEEAAYANIRASTTDVPRIAANTGISEDIIAQVKTHLFLTEHDVPTGPNQLVHGYFTADSDTASLWSKAEAGTLDAGEAKRFSSLMAHEYVERDLMAAGMPYRSAHPAAWENDRELNPSHFGAHEAAPRSSDGTMTQWKKLGLTPPAAPIAPDLSNIDDVINAARRGLHL
ncbi:MAG TPA: hypothetical protein VGI96_20155, partial [Streptosporangiaceae bacterium]